MIFMPAMSMIPTRTVKCLTELKRTAECYTVISECSLIHDARNSAAALAIRNGFDRVLWLDSDMMFDADLLERLSADMNGAPERELVCGLYFKREIPTTPVIYRHLIEKQKPEDGSAPVYEPEIYFDYPLNAIFPVAACGFGAVLTRTDLLRRVWDKYGPPFDCLPGLGEDLSFCLRAGQLSAGQYCDSAVKVGHLGPFCFGENLYMMNRNAAP